MKKMMGKKKTEYNHYYDVTQVKLTINANGLGIGNFEKFYDELLELCKSYKCSIYNANCKSKILSFEEGNNDD